MRLTGTSSLRDEAIMVYCPEAEEQRTHVAAQLVGTGLVSPSQACSGLQVEHEQLQAALHAIGPELRQAVLPCRPGPRGPWKLTVVRQQRGAAVLRDHPQAPLGEVTAAVNRRQSEPLSRRHVQRWRQTEQKRLPPTGPRDPSHGTNDSVPEPALGGVAEGASLEPSSPLAVVTPAPTGVTWSSCGTASRRCTEADCWRCPS